MKRTHAWEEYPPLALDDDGRGATVLDQRALPFAIRYRRLESVDDAKDAIADMSVRGAPLIGLVAAAGMMIAAQHDAGDEAIGEAAAFLLGARPTAVNLRWALAEMHTLLLATEPARRALTARTGARSLLTLETSRCALIGHHGAALLQQIAMQDRARERGVLQVLTHCNAGWLATGAWGTALAPLYAAHAAGLRLHVWVDETRPRGQGARLTAWELGRAGIPHTVIADNAAGHLMQQGQVDACIVGSDRTTRTGDVCNKIGTYQKALAAADNAIPFYVALPVSTIDWELADGRAIVIEARDSNEVTEVEGPDAEGTLRRVRVVAPGSVALNLAFDVTPARLVTALVCEQGVFPASPDGLARLRAMAYPAAAGGGDRTRGQGES